LRDLIHRLLQKDVTKRLGCLRGGAGDIKAHRFFRGLDWDALLRKELPAPWKPRLSNPLDTSNFEEYDEDDRVEQYNGDDAWDANF
jgi:protein kinase X